MKIAFLTCEYPHPKTGSSGGIGTSIKNLAEALHNLGVTVRILVYGQKIDSEFNLEGIIIQQIKNVKAKGLSWWFTSKKIEKIINSLVSKSEIDIVEVHDYTGNSAFMNLDCPVVMKLHGSDTYFCHLDNRSVKWWNKFQEKRAFKRADSIISVSNFTSNLTNQLFNLNRQCETIANGINMLNFNDNDKLQVQSNIILYFGTLIRKKGVLEIPFIFNEVLKKVPDAKLIIVGSDSYDIKTGNDSTWSIMQPLFTENALKNVDYIGRVPYNEIQNIIAQTSVCIFPSFAEAFPVSWLEAMAMGKAVVASDIGWATEMINDGTDGYLRNPKEHFAYAGAICELLLNSEFSNQMGLNAIEKVKLKFQSEVIAKKNIEHYRKVINEF